jgi:hypothetical protein
LLTVSQEVLQIILHHFLFLLEAVINLPADLVLLGVKNKVGLGERTCHPADILNALPALFSALVVQDQLILEFDENLHFLGVQPVPRIAELDVITVLDELLLVFPLGHLILQSSLFVLFFPLVGIPFKAFFYGLHHSGLQEHKILVDRIFNILDPLI